MKLKYHAKYNDAFRLCFSSTLLFFTRKTYREELKGTGEWWKERKRQDKFDMMRAENKMGTWQHELENLASRTIFVQRL